jgi:hypothetical protein
MCGIGFTICKLIPPSIYCFNECTVYFLAYLADKEILKSVFIEIAFNGT